MDNPEEKAAQDVREYLLSRLPVTFYKLRVVNRKAKEEEREAKTKSVPLPGYQVNFFPLYPFYKPISRFDEHESQPSTTD